MGFDLSIAPQNQWREFGGRHASRSNGLIVVEVSLVKVSQSDLKTGGGAMTGGARDTITKLKMDESMRRAASDPATLALPFSFY
jgi:hypothetical protein